MYKQNQRSCPEMESEVRLQLDDLSKISPMPFV